MGYQETLQKIKSRETYIGQIKVTRALSHLAGWKSSPFSSDTLDNYGAVVILADHRAVDYAMLA